MKFDDVDDLVEGDKLYYLDGRGKIRSVTIVQPASIVAKAGYQYDHQDNNYRGPHEYQGKQIFFLRDSSDCENFFKSDQELRDYYSGERMKDIHSKTNKELELDRNRLAAKEKDLGLSEAAKILNKFMNKAHSRLNEESKKKFFGPGRFEKGVLKEGETFSMDADNDSIMVEFKGWQGDLAKLKEESGTRTWLVLGEDLSKSLYIWSWVS